VPRAPSTPSVGWGCEGAPACTRWGPPVRWGCPCRAHDLVRWPSRRAGAKGYVTDATDCDDTRSDVNPGAAEVCDDTATDEDCDDLVDADDPDVELTTYYIDVDGDGWPGTEQADCVVPEGAFDEATDCDDFDPDIHPGGTEVCDLYDADEDCDGLADDDDPSVTGQREYPVDGDGDGYGTDLDTARSCNPPDVGRGDCDDDDPTRYPGAPEVPEDGIDQDCDGDDPIYVYTSGGCACAQASAPSPAAGWLALAMGVVGWRRRR